MKILLCPLSDGGYLYPTIAVGRELHRRGHIVSVLGRSAAAPILAETALPFAAAEDFGERRGFSATWWGTTGLAQYRATLRAAIQAQADLLVTSVLCTGALLAAEVLDIPVVVVGLSVHLWNYRAGGDGEPQPGWTRDNRTREALRLYAACREQAGLAMRSSRRPENPLLGDALLLRGDPAMEYPGAVLPERVHHVGPLAWEPAADQADINAIKAHLDRSGKPVVYVHLGRTFGGTSRWPGLNATFTGGPFQAVVEQGRSSDPRPAPGTDILLVRKPWMGPLIDLAGLVLTSGTSAPVLAALLRGRPLGVSPNGSEQPLLAGACVRAGVAVRVPDSPTPNSPTPNPPTPNPTASDPSAPNPTASDPSAPNPSALLESAWQDRGLRERARELGSRLAAANSAARAADVIEQVARQPRAERTDHGLSRLAGGLPDGFSAGPRTARQSAGA